MAADGAERPSPVPEAVERQEATARSDVPDVAAGGAVTSTDSGEELRELLAARAMYPTGNFESRLRELGLVVGRGVSEAELDELTGWK